MKSLCLLLGCLALAGARLWDVEYPDILEPRISEHIFRDNKEYRYLYNGQILTGLPEASNQYSGLRIQAIFSIQLRQGVDIFKIEKATLARINERDILTGPLRLQPVQDFEELQGEEAREWELALSKPIRFEYEGGIVTNMVSMESDPFWSVNVKRSILATFNVNLKKQQVAVPIGTNHKFLSGWARQPNANNENSEYFTVMEEGIGGECEATYVIQSIPSAPFSSIMTNTCPQCRSATILNVTKTWDYSKCNNRPISMESLNNPVKCETTIEPSMCNKQNEENDYDNIIDSAAHTKYNILGTRQQFIIESAMTEAVHKFTPSSDEAGSMTAYINATMKLIFSGAFSRDSVMPNDAGITLRGLRQIFPRYSRFQNDKYFYESMEANKPFFEPVGQYPNVVAKKEIVKSLLMKLVDDLSDNDVEPESANIVLQLSIILQYATPEEIAEIHQSVKVITHQVIIHEQIQKLWMDILALCGTKPAALFIKQEIANGNLVGERAAQIINTLGFSIRKPDQDIVNEILNLCKAPAVATNSNVKKACWLTFGTLAHTSCVDDVETTTSIQNTVVNTGNPHCQPEVRRRFVTEVMSRLRSSQSEEDHILMLKTIKNMGFIEVVPELKAIFSDDNKPVMIRTEAIYALSHILSSEPDTVVAVLMPEFFDVTNPFQVRIAAFEIIIAAKPDLPVLETIARSLQTEKSIQVGSFVYSKLNSIANSTHPCFEQIAKDASLALEFGKPFYTGLSFSKGYHFGKYSEDLELGGFVEVYTVADPSSIIPRSANVKLNVHAFGLSHDIFQAGINTEGVNAVLKRLFMTRPDSLTNPASIFNFMDEGDDVVDEAMLNRDAPFNYRRAGRKTWNRPEYDEIDRLLGFTDRADQDVRGTAFLKIFGQEVRFLSLTPKSLIRMVSDAYLKPSEMVGLVNGYLPIDYRKAFMAADSEIVLPTELGLPLALRLKAPVVVSAKGSVGLKTMPPLSMSTLANVPHSITLEGDVTVSVASEVHGKMMVWASFLEVGTGIISRISANVPMSGAVTVDIKTGKIQTAFNMPQQPMELINIEVIPMTCTTLIPKTLAPHVPDRKDPLDPARSEKVVQYNRQPLANELPTTFFDFKTSLDENPFMLSHNGRWNTEFYRGLAVPIIDVKEISNLDIIKTKIVDAHVGHPALGFLVKVFGHIQMPTGVPTAPIVPVGGKNRMIVTLLPLNTGLKTVKTTLQLKQQTFSGTTKATWNSLYDQLTGYNTNNLLQQLNANMPVGFDRDDKVGFSTQMTVHGIGASTNEVAMQGVFSWIRGLDGKFIKVAAEFNSPHPQLSYQTCLYGHAEYPSEYLSWMMTPGMNKPVKGRFELAFGRTCNAADATKIVTNFVGDKSPVQLSLEKNDYYTVEGTVIPRIITKTAEPLVRAIKPVYQECENDRKRGIWFSPACQTVKDIYSTLMQMKIDIEYQNIPYGLEKLISKAERLVHSMYFWNSQIDDVRVAHTPNKISILADFTSADERVDLVYTTPRQEVKLLNVPVPYPIAPVSADEEPMNLFGLLFDEDFDDMCTVTSDELITLDNARMKIPVSECYHLLAKDCSAEETFSVLYASAGSRFGEAKKLLAYIGGQKIEMVPADSVTNRYKTGSDMIIRINGRVVSGAAVTGELMVEEGIEITLETIDSQMSPLYKISAESHGVELWFDGHIIAIKPTFWLRNQICGLCGNDNGDEWDDMMLPTGKFADSVTDFVKGYMVRKDSCGENLKMMSLPKTQSLFPTSGFGSDCTKQRTAVKMLPGQICFSIEPVPACTTCDADEEDSSDVEQFTLFKRHAFHCLPEDSTLAQRLLRDVNTRVLNEIGQKQATDYFVLPSNEWCNASNKQSRMTYRKDKRMWA